MLRERGHHVIAIYDADRATLVAALRRFHGALQPDSAFAWVFFAGHAVGRGTALQLVPLASAQPGPEPLPASALFWLPATVVNVPLIAVFDTCQVDAPGPPSRTPTQPLLLRRNALLAFSTLPGEVASDGVGRYSDYTQALLGVLAAPSVSVTDALVKAGQALGARGQHPWFISSLRQSVHLGIGAL